MSNPHRQHHTPAPLPMHSAIEAALSTALAIFIGSGIAALLIHWSLQ